MSSDYSPEFWMGLCMLTECGNHPNEWPYIGHVIKNRVKARGYPDTVVGVVLQPWQFSAFNKYTGDEAARNIWSEAEIGAVVSGRYNQKILRHAIDEADYVLEYPYPTTLSERVLHFWSPQSMVPKWSAPKWASGMRWIVPEGVDGRRFIFGETP